MFLQLKAKRVWVSKKQSYEEKEDKLEEQQIFLQLKARASTCNDNSIHNLL